MSEKPAHLENLWDDASKAMALQLRQEGKGYSEIAAILGRSTLAVKTKILKLTRTPQQREAHRTTERRRYVARVPARQSRAEAKIEQARPPVAVLNERAERGSAPFRDMTAFLCGDPPVGYSALERRA